MYTLTSLIGAQPEAGAQLLGCHLIPKANSFQSGKPQASLTTMNLSLAFIEGSARGQVSVANSLGLAK